jgi:hypothetical protein
MLDVIFGSPMREGYAAEEPFDAQSTFTRWPRRQRQRSASNGPAISPRLAPTFAASTPVAMVLLVLLAFVATFVSPSAGDFLGCEFAFSTGMNVLSINATNATGPSITECQVRPARPTV